MNKKKGYPRKPYSFERVLKDLADDIGYENIETVIEKKRKAIEHISNPNFKDRQLHIQDGLELDIIRTMCFDNDGFLWLGGSTNSVSSISNTTNQLYLYRFNGNSFHKIALPNLKNPINKVTQLYKRKNGLFFIQAKTSNGKLLFSFNPITSQFKSIPLVLVPTFPSFF